MTVGQITNHMSTDAFNVFFFCQRMHYLWAAPFRVSYDVFILCIRPYQNDAVFSSQVPHFGDKNTNTS